jgi:hypothetical protein
VFLAYGGTARVEYITCHYILWDSSPFTRGLNPTQLRDPSSSGGATPSPRTPPAPGQQWPQVGGGEGKPPEVLIKALPLPLEGI